MFKYETSVKTLFLYQLPLLSYHLDYTRHFIISHPLQARAVNTKHMVLFSFIAALSEVDKSKCGF